MHWAVAADISTFAPRTAECRGNLEGVHGDTLFGASRDVSTSKRRLTSAISESLGRLPSGKVRLRGRPGFGTEPSRAGAALSFAIRRSMDLMTTKCRLPM
jgi:hypothetical protein